MPARAVRRAVSALALALALAACGGGDASDVAGGGASGTSAPLAAADLPGGLDFSGPNVTGGDIEATSYTGKDLALWFWAPW